MAIPTGSKYPRAFDDQHQLYTVYDSLKATLAHDYNPGDTVIFVEEDTARFPDKGIITLIDQCADHEERSVSLYYKRKERHAFLDLEVMPDSQQFFKPKKHTKVVMQLRAEHHNSVKDAILAIEGFLGTVKQEDNEPFGPTLFGRINFLKKIIYAPKAWLEADRTTGLAPLTVKFVSKSTGTVGPVGDVFYSWDLGDGTIIQGSDSYVEKTYYRPGHYTVSLTVENAYGTDTVTIDNMVNVRVEAPEEAVINFVPQVGQILTPGEPEGGPYVVPPVLRTPVNQIVVLEIPSGENPNNLGFTYAGEHLDTDTNRPLDAITTYTWALDDDLPHGNSPSTRAAYMVGGLHDLTLRVDTQFGSYRITHYENCIDVVEMRNLWLWTFSERNKVQAHEMGVDNETFKTRHTVSFLAAADDSFLETKQQKKEFRRNCGFAPRFADRSSGLQGTCMLFWASGRRANEPVAAEKIEFAEYNAFTDTYLTPYAAINRPWNWAALCGPTEVYFVLGATAINPPPAMSPTNLDRTIVDLATMHHNIIPLDSFSFINGAQEVQFNPAEFDEEGRPLHGHFSVYRTCWRGYTGFILRNDGVGDYYSLKNFYKTDGTISAPFASLVKLTDVPGGGRAEGQIAPLSGGVYLFDNSSVALLYKEETNTWETTGGGNPGMFRTLQDTRVLGYDSEANSLLVATDGDRKAFLSFDYSHNAFLKFNEADFTYSSMGSRPAGEQWQMGVY